MKKLVLSLLLVAGSFSAFAQGTVQFNNGFTFLTATDQSRLVYNGSIGAGKELVGTQFRAQLYYGTDAANLQAVATTGNNFRAAGTATPGTWASPGSRTLTGFTEGQSLLLQVRVWDTSTGATYDAASVKGQSSVFSYSVPLAGSPATSFYMEGLRAFAVVPEPSTFAFAGIGILGLVMARRRK